MEDWKLLCDALNEELEQCHKEIADLKQKMAVAESALERAQGKLGMLQGHYEERYRMAEKAVMALIMDASYRYGPVDLTISDKDSNDDLRKSIVLHSAPDGVLRELMDNDLVTEVTISWDGVHVAVIPERLDGMFGI